MKENPKSEADQLLAHAMENFHVVNKVVKNKEAAMRDIIQFAQLSATLSVAHYLKAQLEKDSQTNTVITVKPTMMTESEILDFLKDSP